MRKRLGNAAPQIKEVVCVQAWCEAAVGDMPVDTDADTDVGDWLAETSESQSHTAAPTPRRQLSFIGLDTVEEGSTEGTPSTVPTQSGPVSVPFAQPLHLFICVRQSCSKDRTLPAS